MFFISCKQIKYITAPLFHFSKDDAPSNEVFFCYNNKGNFEELGSALFFEYLTNSEYKNILFFIHGFNVQPEAALDLGNKLQEFFNKDNSLGTLVIPIIWPCNDNFGVVRDYWSDQRIADMCSIPLTRALNKLIELQSTNGNCTKRVNILAHSMGNRVLKETLSRWSQEDLYGGMIGLFDNMFLKAPDIVNTSFEPGYKGSILAGAAKKIFVYHAEDDIALRGSKIANIKNRIPLTKRLGHTGPANMDKIPDNIYSVGCDTINTVADPLLGHSYFFNSVSGKPTLVLHHIKDMIHYNLSLDKNRFNISEFKTKIGRFFHRLKRIF